MSNNNKKKNRKLCFILYNYNKTFRIKYGVYILQYYDTRYIV